MNDMSSYQKSITKSEYEPYKTVGRRVLAGFLDGVILSVPWTLMLLISHWLLGNNGYLLTISAYAVISITYTVVFVKRFGGTIGKIVFGLNVLDAANEEPVDWSQSTKRELITMVGSVLQIASIAYYMSLVSVFVFQDYSAFQDTNPLARVIDRVIPLLGLIEIISALTNSKRRALHDYIGGTVVKKVGPIKKGMSWVTIVGVIAVPLLVFRRVFLPLYS